MFNKNGTVAQKAHYADGKLTGEFLQYSTEGVLQVQTFYVDGKKDGIQKTYLNDGSCRIAEYDAENSPTITIYLPTAQVIL